MQILVNTRLLIPERLDGMGWFCYQTLKRITRSHPEVHFVFVFDRTPDHNLDFPVNVTPIVALPQARHPILYYYWLQFSIRPLLQKMKPDLFLSPDGFLPLGKFQTPLLPVIHDLNFEHFPKDIPYLTRHYYQHFFPKFAKNASRICTVSEFSKDDISRRYKIGKEKIDVVYNGINEHFKPLTDFEKNSVRIHITKGDPYFIFVGSLHPRKNLNRLVKAFGLFRKETGSKVKLVLAGKNYWGTHELQVCIRENDIEGEVVFTGRIDNKELGDLLGAAIALVFVPYFEGFGIPMIEAMEAGVPIIAANNSSLPEIGEDAAYYCDPFQEESIKLAMKAVFENPALAQNLVEKGNLQKNKFSWDRSANLLWASMISTIN